MRTFWLTTVLALVLAALTASAAAGATSPTIRMGTTGALSVVGAGFRPNVLVRLHVVGSSLDRRATVRTGPRGGFTIRFAGLERCSAESILARTSTGASARVPVSWFVRECPPPPPLAPGVPPYAP